MMAYGLLAELQESEGVTRRLVERFKSFVKQEKEGPPLHPFPGCGLEDAHRRATTPEGLYLATSS